MTPMRLVRLAVPVLAIACASGGGRGSFNGKTVAAPFSTIHLAETSARVGYHFSTGFLEYVKNLPSNGEHCGIHFVNTQIQGTLPPGLKLRRELGMEVIIEGT